MYLQFSWVKVRVLVLKPIWIPLTKLLMYCASTVVLLCVIWYVCSFRDMYTDIMSPCQRAYNLNANKEGKTKEDEGKQREGRSIRWLWWQIHVSFVKKIKIQHFSHNINKNCLQFYLAHCFTFWAPNGNFQKLWPKNGLRKWWIEDGSCEW